MASNLARRVALLGGGATLYGCATYVTYQYLTSAAADRDLANARALAASSADGSGGGDGDGSACCYSYVDDPKRTQTFQQIAYGYDDQISKDEFVMGINLLRRALLYFHARGQVLEVGAGTGRNLPYYPSQPTVNQIVLTDSSDKMLGRARDKVQAMRPRDRRRFELSEADAANLEEYGDDSFDTIVDTFGLCSFDDPVAVLKELQRVCRPDGKILLLEHGRTKTYEGLSRYLDANAERHARNWGCVFNRDIDRILDDAGLEVERLTTWHFGTTYYVVCRPKREVGTDDVVKKNEDEGVVATSSRNDTAELTHPFWQSLGVDVPRRDKNKNVDKDIACQGMRS